MPAFVDSNLLVYARDASEPEKQPRAAEWLDVLWRTRTGRLSSQVLHEFYVTVTRKLDPGLPAGQARQDVADLLEWAPIPLDEDLVKRAWAVEDDHAISFWDALIVAAAARSRCEVLLSEDLRDGQYLSGVQVVNPFTHPAQAIS